VEIVGPDSVATGSLCRVTPANGFEKFLDGPYDSWHPKVWDSLDVIGQPLVERDEHVGGRGQDGVPEIIAIAPIRIARLALCSEYFAISLSPPDSDEHTYGRDL